MTGKVPLVHAISCDREICFSGLKIISTYSNITTDFFSNSVTPFLFFLLFHFIQYYNILLFLQISITLIC